MPDSISAELSDKLKRLPSEPGVYIMKNARGKIIYVGKAKRLRQRVRSYFQASAKQALRTRKLSAAIADFDVILTASEVDALLAERSLIKHHQPPFNILLRDDKEYPLLRIPFQEKWPRIHKVRRRKDDGAVYLGPFSSATKLRTMLDLTYKVFPLVRCSSYTFQSAKRPCTYYHMKMCMAPCVLPVNNELYKQVLRSAVDFLQGKDKQVATELEKAMHAAAEREDFESAASLRDQLRAFQTITKNQTLEVPDMSDADVLGLAMHEGKLALQVLAIRDGRLAGQDSFVVKGELAAQDIVLETLLMQYYDNRFPPPLILLPIELERSEALETALANIHDIEHPPALRSVKSGPKKKLIDLAQKNAQLAMREHHHLAESKRVELEILQERLHLPHLPDRMECIDISNMQSTAIVASNVCFIAGRPAKNLYRLYNIRDTQDKPDDFASMFEVVQRRLERAIEQKDAPDLLIVDGGKGQLNAALQAAKPFLDRLPDLQIVGLAKSRSKGARHNPRSMQQVITQERVFKPELETPIPLRVGSPEYRLMTQIRDEAHRFAITHHRNKRKKELHSSALEQISGVGPTLRTRLLKTFGSIERLQQTSLEALEAVPGVSKKTAEAIFAFLKQDKDQD